MPTIVGISTFISMINTTSEKVKARSLCFSIPTDKEVSCFKYLRCCIYHANKC